MLEAAERPLILSWAKRCRRGYCGSPDSAGIDLRTRQQIRDVAVSETGATVYLEDGNAIEASGSARGRGSAFDLEWLDSSGLTLDGGIVVDRNFEAAPHVAAIGDVAKFPLRGVDGDGVDAHRALGGRGRARRSWPATG